MTPTEKLLGLLDGGQKKTTRQLTDQLTAQGYAWPGSRPEVTFDRVHHKLIAMLLKGQVKRQKSMGAWIWRAP